MVIWNDSERELLVKIVTSMRMNHPGPTIVTLINRAQQQMPEARRRQITTTTQVPWLVEEVRMRLTRYKSLEVDLQKQDEKVRQLQEALKNPATAMTLKETVLLMFDKIEQRLVSLEARARAQEPLTEIKKPEAIRPKAVKIAVIGTKGDQFQQLSLRFNGTGITLIRADDSLPSKADAAVLTRFCRRKAFDVARSSFPIIIRSSGGIDSWERACQEAARLADEGATNVVVGDFR